MACRRLPFNDAGGVTRHDDGGAAVPPLGTGDLITHAGNHLAVDVGRWRAADDDAAMVCFIPNHDKGLPHDLLPMFFAVVLCAGLSQAQARMTLQSLNLA